MWRSFPKSFSLLLVLALTVVSGCDPAGTATESSPLDEPDPLLNVSAPEKTTKLALLLPADDFPDYRIYEQVALKEAGKAQAILETQRLKPTDPPTRQAEMVREAVARGASALIVVAQDPKSLGPALEEARDKGVAVVLMEHEVASKGKPFPLVARPPYIDIARQLAEAAVKEAKAVGLPPEGPVLILANSRKDAHSAERVEALQTAFKEAGVKVINVKTFGTPPTNPEPDQAKAVVLEEMKSLGSISIVATSETTGLHGASAAREPLGAKGDFVLVGFSNDPNADSMTDYSECAAIGYLNAIGVAGKAVTLALQAVEGKPVPERTEATFRLYRSRLPRPPGGSPMLKMRPGPT